ncbi:SDR family NAD(P)-dependent oxidoreductase [Falsihalocynthiibacter arcticus]|uniref:Uncharacterized protein n=1 Tax=Falsihalocynthiibacter arcticus TaxID=1579316 RepID=A0A126UWH9_9RHOB|nr:SDR family NAD(P)-dependent oxidoreductase [Falsihalocynthiibacter arcticus]AML50432.1 hypothetical protein RC74_03365 [Falsihalocynthiibacter arcticus]
MNDFTGKSAIVTGSVRGQGLAEARLLAQKGAKVMVCDVLDELGALTVEELQVQSFSQSRTACWDTS